MHMYIFTSGRLSSAQLCLVDDVVLSEVTEDNGINKG